MFSGKVPLWQKHSKNFRGHDMRTALTVRAETERPISPHVVIHFTEDLV